MNTYQDRLGFFHDRPCIDGNPSSGNAFLYTAVAHKLGLPVSADIIARTIGHTGLRTRYNSTRPLSRDEFLGLEYLRTLSGHTLEMTWYFHHEKPEKFNLWKLLIQAFHCFDPYTGKQGHRSWFYDRGYKQIYRFAFSCPLTDRHTILRYRGKFNLFYWLIHLVAHIGKPEHRSSRLLRWFKTGKDIDAIANYFPPDHPFVARAKELAHAPR